MTCPNCGAKLRSSGVACGGSPWHEYSCPRCHRRERHYGFGGVEVRSEGRKQYTCGVCDDDILGISAMIHHASSEHPDHMNEALANA